MEILITFLLVIPIGILYSSTCEWLLHRYVMHKNLKFFSYPYQAHTRTHHHIFQADDSYQVKREDQKYLIPMAWWNGPALIAIGSIPFMIISLISGNWWITLAASISITAYYCTYEYIHWCMHNTKLRRVERNGLFFKLNGHHLLHHRYMGKNFNVVLPIADFLLGTLITKSKVKFAQVKGPCMPNVQPQKEKEKLAEILLHKNKK